MQGFKNQKQRNRSWIIAFFMFVGTYRAMVTVLTKQGVKVGMRRLEKIGGGTGIWLACSP